MNEEDFRRIALSLPEAEEKSHFDKPDFRLRGKIFASIKNPRMGIINLNQDQQAAAIAAEPEMFSIVAGSWGKLGWTEVFLADATDEPVYAAMLNAWRNLAPKVLIKACGLEG